MAVQYMNGKTGQVITGNVIGAGVATTGILGNVNIAMSNDNAGGSINTAQAGGAWVGAEATPSAIATDSGLLKFTLTSHGLSVGDVIIAYGAAEKSYNRTLVVKKVGSSSEFTTNAPFISGATVGSMKYRKVTKPLNAQSNSVLFDGSTKLAGTTVEMAKILYGEKAGFYINQYKGYTRIDLTGFDVKTGKATYGANRGVKVTLLDPNPLPNRALPGKLAYVQGVTVIRTQYPASNG